MRADGHAPERLTPDGQHTTALLRRCARDVAEVAEGVRAVSERTAAALYAPLLTASARRRPRTGLPARWALLRALTHKQGLGGSAGVLPKAVGRLLGATGAADGPPGREDLAALTAVTSLRLRTAALLADHPEFARDPGTRLLRTALGTGRDREAVRALRALFRDRGAQRALSGLTPLLTELLSLRALLGEEPADVRTALPAGPDQGEAAAEAVDLTGQERRLVATEGSFLGYLRNIEVLLVGGRLLVQNVRGPDGVVRYVVQAPGTTPGRPRPDSPRDPVGAWRALFTAGSPHTRAIRLAVADYGIPHGADLALIGHGEGGLAVLHLARDPEFTRTYRVTHVVTVGSPVDGEQPADPDTWVAAVVNQHDIMAAPAALDGPDGDGSAAAAAVPHPHPNRYVAEYAGPGPGREFPRSHSPREYIEHLRTVVPEARADIDEALTPYRGPIVRTRAYRLENRANPPEGYPFLTVPTTSVPTTAGPVEVPVRYHDSAAAHLCFPVDADAARALLPDTGRLTPSRFGGRALAVLSLYEHRCTTIGPHTEVALSVPVDDLWRPRPHDIAADLLRRADLRRTGRYVVSLAVTTEEARRVAREIWGQPAMRVGAEADLTDRAIDLRSRDLGLTVEGRLGPGVRCPDADWILYGRRGGSTVRTPVRTHGRVRLHRAHGIRPLLDTAAAEPLAGPLRRLGVDGTRPLFVLTCPRLLAHRGAGTVLPR
ncbi:acetoacetate decarboxylase family protein [Streptomyces sp. LP11]|uniref:Acetoacetate decarboxylase family protein n=1 Tax=Streptomyces pyxinicus TaxID=2970331 RepID=A0ABT2B3J2_9ACTN|nr:acetoacetate decarboxylase family protein [Streptomyces sp. LP11]MCS0602655.1 acetoacetate decarboxylase family protein [Streptomyces sp. LP11]